MRPIALAACLALTAAAGAGIAHHARHDGAPPPAAAPADPAAVRTGDYALDKSHAKIVWGVSHFGFSTYYGEFTDFDARLRLDADDPAASRLQVTVNTASVDTHDEALDTHLRNDDFFGVERHPTATFASTAVERTGPTTARVTGDFTLLGQTRPLTLDVTLNGAGPNPMNQVYTVGFSARGTIRRSEYGMTFAVPGVGDEVQLIISGEFTPAE